MEEAKEMEMEFGCCPICQFPFPVDQLNRHVGIHFQEEDDEGVARDAELARQIALAPPSPTPTPPHVRILLDCFPFLLHASPLRELVGNSRSVLWGYVDHFQSFASEGVGWTCGWRNIQMVTSHLIMRRPEARDVLFGGCGIVPDIRSLQRWLEVAWEKGFDVLGCDDFKGKIDGSNRWIGTTECAALLRSFGLRARIVDFDSKQNEGSKHVDGPMDKFVRTKANNSGKLNKSSDFSSRKSRSYQVLIDWVWTYFFGCKPNDPYQQRVAVSDKIQASDARDVTVQPANPRPFPCAYITVHLNNKGLERSPRKNHGWQRMIKRGIYTLKKPQYQLCYVDPGFRVYEVPDRRSLAQKVGKSNRFCCRIFVEWIYLKLECPSKEPTAIWRNGTVICLPKRGKIGLHITRVLSAL
ncbi:Zinc finger-containing ubiquitin peptidase 1-like protein [Drosera capensis]